MRLCIGVLTSVFWFFSCDCIEASESGPAVTYGFSGGRFGDNLLSYLHAKWLSYRYQIPLLYKTFPYSSQLMMDIYETPIHSSTRQTVELTGSNLALLQSGNPDLYICPYFSECPLDAQLYRLLYIRFNVDWNDQEFRRVARKMIAPKIPLNLLTLSKNTINIAIHFREGGGFDKEADKIGDPLKFPSIHFYIDSLEKILSFFKGLPIYCYIFTDAVNTELIVEQIKKEVHSENEIIYDYRKMNNHHRANVLEDFFSLFHFDILIRPQSNFSMIPSFLNDYAITSAPTHCSIIGREVSITKFDLNINKKVCDELLQRIGK